MKLSTSDFLEPRHRTLEYNQRFIFSVACWLPFDLLTGEVKKADELSGALSEVEALLPLDSMVKKQSPEYLLSARACAPEGETVTGLEVAAEVGPLRKKLLVFGDRFWQANGLPSDPAPFKTMPIMNTLAFGGELTPPKPLETLNALGKGLLPDEDGIYWLPNIEYPGQLMTHKGARPIPAGFMPLSAGDATRLKRMGQPTSSDDQYAYPRAIDWHYFNDAPEDQWFKQPLNGDEQYRFYNMHPEHPVIKGQLPQRIARAFVKQVGTNKSGESETYFMELPLTLDTLWFCPHQLTGALVFHGSVECSDRYGQDIQHLLTAFEDKPNTGMETQTATVTSGMASDSEALEPVRDQHWYLNAMSEREDPELTMKFMTYVRDIVPPTVELEDDGSPSDDPDAIQGFVGANINTHVDKEVGAMRADMVQSAEEMEKQMDSALVQLSEQRDNLVKTQQEIENSIKASQPNNPQTLELVKQKQNLDEQILKLNGILEDSEQNPKNTLIELKKLASGEDIEHELDPDEQKLQDFIDEALPKSKTDPDKIDMLAVDMKKVSQIGDKVEEFADKKKADMLPEMQQNFADIKAEIVKVPDTIKIDEGSPEEVIKTKQEVEQKTQQSLADIEEMEADFTAMLKGETKPEPLPRPVGGEALDDMEASIKQARVEIITQLDEQRPELEKARTQIEQALVTIPANSEQAKELNESLANLEKLPTSEALNQDFDEQEQEIVEAKQRMDDSVPDQKAMYLISAHNDDEGLPPQPIPLEDVRANFDAMRAETSDLSEQDWACLEFEGEQFDTLDLSGCYLEQTRFVDCSFKGVMFDKAIMARASFEGCRFELCSLLEANLGAASVLDCEWVKCDLSNTILAKSTMESNAFRECIFDSNDASELALRNNAFDQSYLLSFNLSETDLFFTRFVRSYLHQCQFSEVRAPELVCYETDLQGCNFSDVLLPDADFSGCTFENFTVSGMSSLEGANFTGCKGKGLNMSEVIAQRICFVEAEITDAYMEGCYFPEADLRRSDFRNATWSDAHLEGAQFQNANLMQANFGGANLVSANLRGSNCYAVNFLDATLGNTTLAGADLSYSQLQDWRP